MYSIPLANRIATDCIFVHLEVTKWWSFVNYAKKIKSSSFFSVVRRRSVSISICFFLSVNTEYWSPRFRCKCKTNKVSCWAVECWRHDIMISISIPPKQSKQNSDDDDWSHVSNEWYTFDINWHAEIFIHEFMICLAYLNWCACLCRTTKCDRIASKIFE